MNNSDYMDVDIFGSEPVRIQNNYNKTPEEEEAANLMTKSKNKENINLKTNENYIEINMVLCDRYGWERKKIEKKKRSPLNIFKKKKDEYEVVEQNKCTGDHLELAFNPKIIINHAIYINELFETHYREYPENDIKFLFYRKGDTKPFGIFGVKGKYVKESRNIGIISTGIFLSNDDGGTLYDTNKNAILIGEVLSKVKTEKVINDNGEEKEIKVPDNDRSGIFIFDDFIKNRTLNYEYKTSIFEMTDEFYEKNITQRRLNEEENIKRNNNEEGIRKELIEDEENTREGLIKDEENEEIARKEREWGKEYIDINEEEDDEKPEGGKRIRRKTIKHKKRKTIRRIKHKKRKTIKHKKRKTHKRRH